MTSREPDSKSGEALRNPDQHEKARKQYFY
jgi:hypothetical protein